MSLYSCSVKFLMHVQFNQLKKREMGIKVIIVDKEVYFIPRWNAMYKEHFMHLNVPCHNAYHFLWSGDLHTWYCEEWKIYFTLTWYRIMCKKNIDIQYCRCLVIKIFTLLLFDQFPQLLFRIQGRLFFANLGRNTINVIILVF